MTEHDRERSLDETQPIQTPATADPPVGSVPAVEPPAAPVAATDPTPPVAATGPATFAPPPVSAPVAADREPWSAAGATTVQPVQAPRRSGGARWAVAAVLIVAVVGVAAAAALLLTGRSAPPDAFAYLPANTAMVIELRPDLPGDQREKLAQLISKFPGFADQSTFETKLDEAIDRFADEAAGRDVDYANEVKPFLGHPLVLGVTKVPEDAEASEVEGFVGIATSTGTPRCSTPAFGTVSQTVEHAGRTISIIEADDPAVGCVVDGQNILIGNVDDLKIALDTKDGSASLAGDPAIEGARAKLGGDTLGLIYMSKAGFDGFARIAEQQQTAEGLPPVDMSALPDWLVMGLRAESDGLLFDVVMPYPAPAAGASPFPSSAPKVSAIASKLPATTIAAFEARDFGTTIDTALDQFATMPEAADAIRQLDVALAFMGGRDALLAWMDDASVVVTRDGTTFGGGLVFATPDVDKATATLTQLKALLGMAGLQGIEGITTSDEAYGGGTITTVTFDLQQLSTAVGGADLGPDVPQTFALAFTTQGGLVIFGAGSDFVKDVIDTAPGQSLADQPRYQAAMRLVGAENTGQAYFDLAAGIDAIEEFALPLAAPDMLTEWQRDIAPFVEPLDAIAFAGTADGSFIRFRIGLTAHEARQ